MWREELFLRDIIEAADRVSEFLREHGRTDSIPPSWCEAPSFTNCCSSEKLPREFLPH
jgi:hypothetical protein